MTPDRADLRTRMLETVLWAAVILVGGHLLLPAAVDLVQTTQQEKREAEATRRLEQQLREVQDRLLAFPEDPEALRKLAELQAEKRRREQDEHGREP